MTGTWWSYLVMVDYAGQGVVYLPKLTLKVIVSTSHCNTSHATITSRVKVSATFEART